MYYLECAFWVFVLLGCVGMLEYLARIVIATLFKSGKISEWVDDYLSDPKD